MSVSSFQPLAERMRPTTLDEYVGQEHLIAKESPLSKMLEQGHIPSLILWGPPGVGKTSLAEIMAMQTKAHFFKLSAVGSGVSEVRKVLEQAEEMVSSFFHSTARPILFIDEIHRFSKSQQDSLLSAVERGIISLIGATTENPSFEVIRPLLSRCQVFVLHPIEKKDLQKLLQRAINTDPLLKEKDVQIKEDERLILSSGGDARKLLNLLEVIVATHTQKPLIIDNELVAQTINKQPLAFDKGGEMHYDIASAFIKSIRGSDPDAALYWLARLIEGGESPSFIARRIVLSASEDIGLANPNALLIANAAAQAVQIIGWPEGRIPLAQAVVYLATSPKSNSAYNGINKALDFVRKTGNLPVPLHLRNAPTKLMNELNYGVDYKYPHNYNKHYIEQEYLPKEIQNTQFYYPQNVGQAERNIIEYLKYIHPQNDNKKTK